MHDGFEFQFPEPVFEIPFEQPKPLSGMQLRLIDSMPIRLCSTCAAGRIPDVGVPIAERCEECENLATGMFLS